jgi:hypothetical protein
LGDSSPFMDCSSVEDTIYGAWNFSSNFISKRDPCVTSFSRSSGTWRECDANCANGNVVVPVTSEGISCSSFYASKSGARGWKGSHSYCCDKFNNVSSARVAPIQQYGVTYGQLACGLGGVYGYAKPAQFAGCSSQLWINTYKNFFMNGVATYTQKQMKIHTQWSFGFIALEGGWRQKCVKFHRCELC